MKRLFADQHFPKEAADELRKRGYDVLTARQAGMSEALDPEILRFSVKENRITLTNDKGFQKKHPLVYPRHNGIVHYTKQETYFALADRIDKTLNAYPDLSGRVAEVRKPSQQNKPFEPRIRPDRRFEKIRSVQFTKIIKQAKLVNRLQSLEKAYKSREIQKPLKEKTKGLDYEQ